MAKPTEIPAKKPVISLLSAKEYCISRKLNKLSSLIFIKAMANKYNCQRFSETEWDIKRKELYSR